MQTTTSNLNHGIRRTHDQALNIIHSASRNSVRRLKNSSKRGLGFNNESRISVLESVLSADSLEEAYEMFCTLGIKLSASEQKIMNFALRGEPTVSSDDMIADSREPLVVAKEVILANASQNLSLNNAYRNAGYTRTYLNECAQHEGYDDLTDYENCVRKEMTI